MTLLLLASLATVSSTARADSITLDTGATIEGDLARYEFGGDCQLSVTEGELSGVILIVPCHRVQSFVRTVVRAPIPIGLEQAGDQKLVAEEVIVAGADGGALPVVTGDAAAAGIPVEAALASGEAASVAPEPTLSPTAPVPSAAPVSPRTETRAVSFGQAAAGAVEMPVEVPVEEAPFYDEPLFPADATTPIGVAVAEPVAAEPARAAASSGSGTGGSGMSSGIPQRSAPTLAPSESSVPRPAPRMDEPSSRPVSF